jgi:ribonuclease VapC
MIVDTSALVAILLEEPEGHLFDVAILNCPDPRISSATYLEAAMVLLARRGSDGMRALDLLILRAEIEIVSFTESHARLAKFAFERYGRGFHRAKLNFGDCMAYALAKETGEELLFKGTDFSLTDIPAAAY